MRLYECDQMYIDGRPASALDTAQVNVLLRRQVQGVNQAESYSGREILRAKIPQQLLWRCKKVCDGLKPGSKGGKRIIYVCTGQ